MSSAHKPKLSVVMPVLNHARTLASALISADNQLTRIGLTHEIIIIDRGSNDATPELAERFSSLIPGLIFLKTGKITNENNAVKIGLFRAKGDWRIIMPAHDGNLATELQKIIPHLVNGYDLVLGSSARNRSGSNSWLQFSPRFFKMLHNTVKRPGETTHAKSTLNSLVGLNGSATEKLCSEMQVSKQDLRAELSVMARRHDLKIKEISARYGGIQSSWENIERKILTRIGMFKNLH